MPKIETVTQWVKKDEKAYFLVEVDGPPKLILNKPGYGRRRYQVIWVNRNDTLAAYVTDLGESSTFAAKQFRIPSIWEHTVAELQAIAEDYRTYGYLDDQNYLLNMQKESEETFHKRFTDYAEEGHKILYNISEFGPGVNKQRVLAHRFRRDK